eukprot:TRINITY_DN8298_c0_g1_i1.p1 TRINITY_DN8298_c0_g1~~TRINITY_DN8298_c0_g1_i1.p1  ORF type:complete len:265 (+),score=60.24 TRINITY_DN8298_c0_g1_i1:137-931(+)
MGSWPIEMNTADVKGDIFFDVRGMVAPMECRQDPQGHDCVNPEVESDDLVITKLILTVDETQYGQYGKCNICVNGTDHHGDDHCVSGEYICDCEKGYNKSHVDCTSDVGADNITETFAQRSCRQGSPNWECWQDATAHKTGGMWYSTTREGYCGNPNATRCTWKVAEFIKVVNKTCSDNHIHSMVESHNQTCFDACGPTRNVTSDCYITCFYNTVLGPDAGVPGGQITGLPLSDLITGWDFPFNSDSCPGLPPKKNPDYPNYDF